MKLHRRIGRNPDPNAISMEASELATREHRPCPWDFDALHLAAQAFHRKLAQLQAQHPELTEDELKDMLHAAQVRRVL